MMRHIVVAGIVVSLSILARAESVLIPLVDPSDPILITNSMLEFVDDVRPVMILELENRTAVPVSTGEIWLDRARFYTKSESAKDRRVWDCWQMSSASRDEPPVSIAPGQRAIVRVALGTTCEYHREHEHFFVQVARVATRVSEPMWKRDSRHFVRLLAAAQPHP